MAYTSDNIELVTTAGNDGQLNINSTKKTPIAPPRPIIPFADDDADELCCICFDLRTGVMMIGVWLLLQAALTVTVFVVYADKVMYNGNGYHYAIIMLSIDIGFDLIGATLGIIGSIKKSQKIIYLFYIWGLMRVFFAAVDAFWSFLYLLVLGVWIYWTVIIKKYHRILTIQRLIGTANRYASYNDNHKVARNETNEGKV